MQENLKRRVSEKLDELQSVVVKAARRIYENPETAYQEYRASSILCGVLQENGFQVELGIGGHETAFRAQIPSSSDGPVVAILAEYDALPDLGHACGHNLIAGAALAAALGLKAVAHDLSGRVVLIGTPGEEGGGGKISLMESGCFDDVDLALMIHPGDSTVLEEATLAVGKVNCIFTGRASHAASSPESGINALDAVIQTFNGLNALRQHIPSHARIHGIITDGGSQPNIVPAHAAARFYVRARTAEEMNALMKRFEACAQGAALATGATLEFQRSDPDYLPVRTNRELALCFGRNLSLLGLRIDAPTGRTISTDLGNVSQKIPAIHPLIAICPRGVELHTAEFHKYAGSPEAFKIMMKAGLAIAMTAIDVLNDRSLFEKIRSEASAEH